MATPTPIDPVLLTTSYSTIYTIPGSKRGIVKELLVCNSHTAAVKVGINFVPTGGSATATNQIRSFGANNTLASDDSETWAMDTFLEAGATIQAKADVGAVVSIRPSIVLETV